MNYDEAILKLAEHRIALSSRLAIRHLLTHPDSVARDAAQRAVIERLHDSGVVFVSSYRRAAKGPAVPRFSVGNEPDAKRPGKMSASEKNKRYRRNGKDAVARGLSAVAAGPSMAGILGVKS